VSGILPARFPGELRDRLREIKIDMVRATARASDGLPAIPKQRPDGIGFGQRLTLRQKPDRRDA
jgi:hypothetical protein